MPTYLGLLGVKEQRQNKDFHRFWWNPSLRSRGNHFECLLRGKVKVHFKDVTEVKLCLWAQKPDLQLQRFSTICSDKPTLFLRSNKLRLCQKIFTSCLFGCLMDGCWNKVQQLEEPFIFTVHFCAWLEKACCNFPSKECIPHFFTLAESSFLS